LGGHRDGEAEGAALAFLRFHLDAAVVRLDKGARDVEAESEAVDAAGASLEAVEALENAGLLLWGDADALIGDADRDLSPVDVHVDHDIVAVKGVFHCV